MNKPFVMSIKAFLDAEGVTAGTKEAERALINLNSKVASSEINLRNKINQSLGIGASTRNTRDAEADIGAYGRRLDELRAKFNPVYSAHQRYRQSLSEIKQAHAVGAISTDEMTMAIQRERQAALGSIAALKGRTSALHGMSAASNKLNFQQRNLMYQLVDVGQMLALQQPLHMLALQQGPQIAQIYGPGEGGIGRAFKESGKMIGGATKGLFRYIGAHPIAAAAIVGTTGALAGYRHELDKATDKSVGFGDVIKASFQVIGDGLYDAYIKPFEKQITAFFDWAWKGTVWLTKTLINSVVVTVGSAGLAVEYAGLALWTTVKALAANMQNFFVDILQSISNFITGGINLLIENVNKLIKNIGADHAAELFGLPAQFEGVKPVDLSGARAKYSDFGGEMDRLNKTYGGGFDDLFTKNHAENYFGATLGKINTSLSKPTKEQIKEAERLKKAYDTIIGSVKERIAASHLEAKALGMTEEAANRLRYAQDLMNQAERAGIALSPKQRAKLQELAGDLAAVEAQTKRLTEAYEFSKSVFTGFFTDMRSGLSEGKTLWEALGGAGINALNKIADKALSMAADGIFDMIFGAFKGASGGSGGGIGGFFSNIFGIGRNAKGTDFWQGGLTWVGEEGPEIINLQRGAQVISNPAARTMVSSAARPGFGAANDNSTSVFPFTYAPTFNISGGADAGANERMVRRALAEERATIQKLMPGWMRDAQRRAA